jgi:hypothetical protein
MATIKEAYDALYVHEKALFALGAHSISVEEEGRNNFVVVLWFEGIAPEVPANIVSAKGAVVMIDTRHEERFRPE